MNWIKVCGDTYAMNTSTGCIVKSIDQDTYGCGNDIIPVQSSSIVFILGEYYNEEQERFISL